MGFLHSWVAPRGNWEAAMQPPPWVEERDHKGSSLNRLGEWSRFWWAVLTLLQGGVKTWWPHGWGLQR